NYFWEKIKKLREYTDKSAKKFSKDHEGSTGWEYSVTMAYVDGSFYYSGIKNSKNYTQVRAQHSLSIKPEIDNKNEIVRDNIILDDNKVGILIYKGANEIEARNEAVRNRERKYGFVCNFHSHPQNQVKGLDKNIYT